MSKPRKLLIDADGITCRFAYANTETYDFGDGEEPIVIADEDKAIKEAEEFIFQLETFAKADEVLLCFSDPRRRYFRHDIEESYKANRKGTKKPELVHVIQHHLVMFYKNQWFPNLEADDVLGILATGERDYHPVIWSADKDLLQIPGEHISTDGMPFSVTDEEGYRMHLYQTLCGDSTDGYPGCPKIGPKRADKAFEVHGVSWQTVVSLFGEKGLPEAEALKQARLAKILTKAEWDSTNKEVIHWSPPVVQTEPCDAQAEEEEES